MLNRQQLVDSLCRLAGLEDCQDRRKEAERVADALLLGPAVERDPEAVSVHVLSRETHIPTAWLRAEAKAGNLPCLMIGKRTYFNPAAVRRAIARMAAHRHAPAPVAPDEPATKAADADPADPRPTDPPFLLVMLMAGRKAGDSMLESLARDWLAEVGIRVVLDPDRYPLPSDNGR